MTTPICSASRFPSIFGFDAPLSSSDTLGSNLYRSCYWYFIQDNILETRELLQYLGEKTEKYKKFEQVISVICNHLSPT